MEIISKIKNVNSIRVFGSHARGDQNVYSDFDVLVILQKSQVINDDLEKEIKELFDREISISWYSEKRINKLFEMGHLFAWHLYNESYAITNDDYFQSLGKPAEYKFAIQDIHSLLGILVPIQEAVKNCPRNLIYEAGLLYVCVRNIAICAMPSLRNQYSFNTDVPFKLDIPVSVEEFNLLLQARYAGTRGTKSPELNAQKFDKLFKLLEFWALQILEQVKKKSHEN